MLDVVSSENREKTLRFVLTFYRQATDRLPTHYQQSADCRPTGSLYFGQNLSAVCRPTVDRQSADRFFGELFSTITERVWHKDFRWLSWLYLKSDVLLLIEVFEEFKTCVTRHTNYKLDPAWYYTPPGLSWDAALKVTHQGLYSLADHDMLLMIEKGIRGGVSMISDWYGKANSPYMGEDQDPRKPTKLIHRLSWHE